MKTLGYIEKVKINDKILNIEVVNKFPVDFSFIEKVNGYKVYEKQEIIGDE